MSPTPHLLQRRRQRLIFTSVVLISVAAAGVFYPYYCSKLLDDIIMKRSRSSGCFFLTMLIEYRSQGWISSKAVGCLTTVSKYSRSLK